jgi:hypothetical protein
MWQISGRPRRQPTELAITNEHRADGRTLMIRRYHATAQRVNPHPLRLPDPTTRPRPQTLPARLCRNRHPGGNLHFDLAAEETHQHDQAILVVEHDFTVDLM